MTDIETWLLDNKDTIFSIQEYKRLFTPHEQEQKYIDETEFTDSPELVKIVQAIEVPNDVLLKMQYYFKEDDLKPRGVYLYRKLSDIRLTEYDFDNKSTD